MIRDYLFFTRNPDQSMWGSVTADAQVELERLVKQAAAFPGPIIEIGTLFGFTAQFIATIKRPDQRLITVDNYSWNPFKLPPPDHYAFTQRVLHHCQATTALEVVRGSSLDFFNAYKGPAPALVFLDGSHGYDMVVQEIRQAKRLGTHLISGDDLRPKWPGVEKAVREEFGDDFEVKHALWSTRHIKPA